jgi:hypothetical protein
MKALVENNQVTQYPYSIDRLLTDNRSISFPDNIHSNIERQQEYGVFDVAPADPIDYDPMTQRVEHGDPVLVGGQWKISSQVVDLNNGQLQAKLNMLKESIEEATEQRLEDAAKGRGYKSLDRLLNYTNSTNEKWATEAIYMQQLQTQTWEALLSILAAVNAGTREAPASYEEIEPELPVIDWPE